MPFGLCNALVAIKSLMNSVLRGPSWKTRLVYLEVIMVIKKFDEYLEDLREVLQRFREANVVERSVIYFKGELFRPRRQQRRRCRRLGEVAWDPTL